MFKLYIILFWAVIMFINLVDTKTVLKGRNVSQAEEFFFFKKSLFK